VKKRTKPDLKACIHSTLRCAAQQLELLNIIDLYGVNATDASPAEAKIYEDARALAIAYIKKGAEL